MFKKLLTTRSLCLSAIIAALYAALTLLLAHISYGPVQLKNFRNSSVSPKRSRCCRWCCRSRFPACSWAA